MSPSHAVGLEQKKLYTFVSLFLDFLMSPSHTVGSERKRVFLTLSISLSWSPSHTVGLEQKPYRRLNHEKQVAIPHSGLRTTIKVWNNQVAQIIAIPHGGLGTLLLPPSMVPPSSSPSHTVGLEQKEGLP
jgi:hypothetical protein